MDLAGKGERTERVDIGFGLNLATSLEEAEAVVAVEPRGSLP
jgi:hypothetical protein